MVQTKRRARFKRATSGTQNLTTLIYNILKDQIASKKSAVLSAWDANMRSRTYDSTYGGQPVNRAAVEAFYNEMIAVYPAGTTEHDRLVAELNDFRSTAVKQEMAAYQQAYSDGTYAFGKKIGINDYLSFLRDAKSTSSNEADRAEYTREEFLVMFNDGNNGLKARGASAGAFKTFYERQLAKAKEMGITGDAYTTIEGYLATARKQAGVEYKAKLLQDATDAVNKGMGKIGSSILEAAKLAAQKGTITQETLIAMGASGLDIVQSFSKMDPGAQARIISAGIEAGIQLNGQDFGSSAIINSVDDLRNYVKKIANSSDVPVETRSRFLNLLDQIDANASGPLGMLSDIEVVDRASSNMLIDNISTNGNPVVMADLYSKFSDKVSPTAAGNRMGRGMQDILKGKVPDGGAEFLDLAGKPKTELWQLTQPEVASLIDKYSITSTLFTNGAIDPKQFIQNVYQDYTDKHNVDTGKSFLAFTINSSGTPEVVVTNAPVVGGVPTLTSTTLLTDGSKVSTVARQAPIAVKNAGGFTLGYKIFNIDSNGQAAYMFKSANDGYTMNWDRYEMFMSNNGVSVVDDGNGGVLANTDTTLSSNSNEITADPSFQKDVSSRPFNGIAKGPGYVEALKGISSTIANSVINGGDGAIFGIDGTTGKIIVKDRERALALTGINASDIELFINEDVPRTDINGNSTPGWNAAQSMISDAIFRASERASLAEPNPDPQALMNLRLAGARAAADAEAKVAAQKRMDLYGKAPGLGGPNPPFFIPDANQLGLSPADTAKLNALNGQGPAEKRFNDVYQPLLTQQRVAAEIKASPFVSGVNKTVTPSSDYFFRYASPFGTGVDSGYTPAITAPSTSISGGGVTFNASLTPKFTPAQVSSSLVDFRAGERSTAPAYTPISTSPKTTAGGGV